MIGYKDRRDANEVARGRWRGCRGSECFQELVENMMRPRTPPAWSNMVCAYALQFALHSLRLAPDMTSIRRQCSFPVCSKKSGTCLQRHISNFQNVLRSLQINMPWLILLQRVRVNHLQRDLGSNRWISMMSILNSWSVGLSLFSRTMHIRTTRVESG